MSLHSSSSAQPTILLHSPVSDVRARVGARVRQVLHAVKVQVYAPSATSSDKTVKYPPSAHACALVFATLSRVVVLVRSSATSTKVSR